LTTFGRGVPVLRYTNKVHVLQHDKLENPVAIIAAGTSTYFDKFQHRACQRGIALAAGSHASKGKLDITEFAELVCEPIMTALLKEYAIDRAAFLGAPIVEFSLSLIAAGLTHGSELRAYFIHTNGVSEPLEHYGTIGSGAAYAEFLLRFLLAEPRIGVSRAAELAVYVVKGVELMDPNVGGDVNVRIITAKDRRLDIAQLARYPAEPRETMEQVLQSISAGIGHLVVRRERKHGKGKRQVGGSQGHRH